jgi:hypothetical protein
VDTNLHAEKSADRKGPPTHAYDCKGWASVEEDCALLLENFDRDCWRHRVE